MSIRLRFTLALTGLGLLLFGVYAVLAHRSERDDLRQAATAELRVVGQSLQTALGNALRDRQRSDIDETLSTIHAVAPALEVLVVDPVGEVIAPARASTAVHEVIRDLAKRALAANSEGLYFDPPDDPERMIFTGTLTADDGGVLGAVAVARPTRDMEDDLERTRNRLLLALVTFVGAMTITGVVLGTLYVSKPIARLLDGVHQIRQGDFRARVGAGRDDEIGALVSEFNTMIEALTEQRTRADAEANARTRLELGLQRVDKLVSIGQLSAGLAHEIGSPLQVLSGRASLLLAHADPEVRRQADQLVAQCARITTIVEQLLSVGRRKGAVIAPCDLVVPVRAVIELLGSEARRRDIALVMEVDDRRHDIDGDHDQIQQIALNLIRNALAATPRHGTVTVRIDRVGDVVRLSVRDTGIGIDAATRPRLFEPFFTTRAAEGGTGLGLTVVRAIADEHEAKVDVYSEPGCGAELVVSFPARLGGSRG